MIEKETIEILAEKMAKSILSSLDAENHPCAVFIEPYIRVEINHFIQQEKIHETLSKLLD